MKHSIRCKSAETVMMTRLSKVTVVAIIIGMLGRASKNLINRLVESEVQRRIETIQMTALLKLGDN